MVTQYAISDGRRVIIDSLQQANLKLHKIINNDSLSFKNYDDIIIRKESIDSVNTVQFQTTIKTLNSKINYLKWEVKGAVVIIVAEAIKIVFFK